LRVHKRRKNDPSSNILSHYNTLRRAPPFVRSFSMVSSAPTHKKWKTFWYSLVFGVRTTLVPWINVRGGSLEVPWDAVEIELPLSRWRVDACFLVNFRFWILLVPCGMIDQRLEEILLPRCQRSLDADDLYLFSRHIQDQRRMLFLHSSPISASWRFFVTCFPISLPRACVLYIFPSLAKWSTWHFGMSVSFSFIFSNAPGTVYLPR
jgi:hypothetical protein